MKMRSTGLTGSMETGRTLAGRGGRLGMALLLCGAVSMLPACATNIAQSQHAQPAPAGAAASVPSAAQRTQDNRTAPAGPVQSAVTQLPDSNSSPAPAGNIQELQQYIQRHEIAELRTTYNGTFGASLLFYPPDLTYYVALFHHKQFWRVAKVDTAKRAEALYRDFSQQTVTLAQAEIHRIELEAQKNYMEKQLSENEARLAAVRSDLAVQRQQERQLVQSQQQVREQTNTLDAERAATRRRLDDVRSQIRALERQQNRTDANLLKQIQSSR